VPRFSNRGHTQGCQMVKLHTRIPNLGIFWMALEWKLLVYYITIWYFSGRWLNFASIWYSLWSNGIGIFARFRCTKKNLATLHTVLFAFTCKAREVGKFFRKLKQLISNWPPQICFSTT
jgi:hypothetical protein